MTIIRDEVFRTQTGEILTIRVKAVKTPFFAVLAAMNGQTWVESPTTGQNRTFKLTVNATEPDTTVLLKFLDKPIDPAAAYEVTVSGDNGTAEWKRTFASFGFDQFIRLFDFVI